MYNNQTDSIRVPSNTHPSHALRPNQYLSEDEDEDFFYSAQGTPISRPQSIRASIQNFAGSYSRASILYMADAVSAQSSHATNAVDAPVIVHDDEEQLLYKPKYGNSIRQCTLHT